MSRHALATLGIRLLCLYAVLQSLLSLSEFSMSFMTLSGITSAFSGYGVGAQELNDFLLGSVENSPFLYISLASLGAALALAILAWIFAKNIADFLVRGGKEEPAIVQLNARDLAMAAIVAIGVALLVQILPGTADTLLDARDSGWESVEPERQVALLTQWSMVALCCLAPRLIIALLIRK